MSAQRVYSLKEVAESAAIDGSVSYPLRDFLDGFYANPDREKFVEEPAVLCDALNDDGFADAYLAAVCDHLCRINGFVRPAWIKQPRRALKLPYFGATTHGLRMIYLQESPSAFRERNIFVSANCLARA